MDKKIYENKNNWEARSANFQNDIKSVLYKRFPISLNNHIHNWHNEIILNIIPNENSLRILDIGCGYGRITMPLINRNDKIEVTGIDISENFIRLYRENTHQIGIVSSIEVIPENIGKFDYIICITVLMYVEEKNISRTIKNLQAHLKEDGKIILIEPLLSGYFFISGFGILNFYNAKHKSTGGNCFKVKHLEKLIKQNNGVITMQRRIPVTTIFIIPIYLLTRIFKKSKFQFFFKLISRLDNFFCNLKLPSMHIALTITKNKVKN